jgi:murein tripeptide amidase MpaA
MKKVIIIVIVLVVLGILGFFIFGGDDSVENQEQDTNTTTTSDNGSSSGLEDEEMEEETGPKSVIGKSVQGRDIEAYTYGTGADHLLFVGGIHGGYSWNTALVAYELVDYLDENPSAVPSDVKVTVIPVMNPDGLQKVIGTTGRFSHISVPSNQEDTVPGRFNANDVDLNRNFDCDWQTEATWQDKQVSGGTSAFSEPESKAVRNFINTNRPDAVVVWYSAVGGVFASNCHEGVLPETLEILNIYADASGYPAYEEFNFYEITGDMTNWLASIEIPAISVLLTTHQDVEWDKNLKGIKDLFEHYSSN